MSIRLDNSNEGAAGRLVFDSSPSAFFPSIRARQGSGPAELSFAQERIWFLDQIASGDALFNLSQGVWIGGPLDVERLHKALTALIADHEILRTTFAKSEHYANTDGRPRQIVGAPVPATLDLIEIEA